jgi:hypothetical protein
MKYIKKRYQFLNEAFDSKAISKTLSFLDKNFNKTTKDEFLNVLKKMKDNYDYPIDKIDDSFIKYTNKKEAIKIKFDGEIHNDWGIYCLKFWFSLELGYIGYTATSNRIKEYKRSKGNESFDGNELSHIKSTGITTGKLKPVVDYSLLKDRGKVVGYFSDYLDDDTLSIATIIIDENDKIYAIQNVNDGSSPDRDTGWRDFGRYAWYIGKNDQIGHDHQKLHHYEFDNEPLRVEEVEKEVITGDNPLDWNLPVKKGNGRISDWKSDYSSIGDEGELDKADFSIILFFDDMINPDKAAFYERPSDISKERQESRKGSLKLMSDEEIKKINIERYLNQLISKVGISVDKSNFKNLQKIIGTSLVGKYSLISILSGNYKVIDNFINYLYNFIRHFNNLKDAGIEMEDPRSKRDREHYFKELMDQYKTIYNRSLNFRKNYDKSYDWIIKNHSGDDEKSVLIIEILSKVIEIGSKIFDMVSAQEANSIQDMRVIKSKIDTIKNLLYEDVFILSDSTQQVFKYFNDLSDVDYYLDRISVGSLKESKEKLKDIEKAVISILK